MDIYYYEVDSTEDISIGSYDEELLSPMIGKRIKSIKMEYESRLHIILEDDSLLEIDYRPDSYSGCDVTFYDKKH